MEQVDAKQYGLPARTVLYTTDEGLLQVIDRKSRFVMKDAEQFLVRREKLRSEYDIALSLAVRTAPVCSKARKRLAEEGAGLDS